MKSFKKGDFVSFAVATIGGSIRTENFGIVDQTFQDDTGTECLIVWLIDGRRHIQCRKDSLMSANDVLVNPKKQTVRKVVYPFYLSEADETELLTQIQMLDWVHMRVRCNWSTAWAIKDPLGFMIDVKKQIEDIHALLKDYAPREILTRWNRCSENAHKFYLQVFGVILSPPDKDFIYRARPILESSIPHIGTKLHFLNTWNFSVSKESSCVLCVVCV